MASKSYHCQGCNIYFDSDQSLKVHTQYHKENLINMWMGTEEVKKEIKKEIDMENEPSLFSMNYNSASSVPSSRSENCDSIFAKQNVNTAVVSRSSFTGPSPTSPMDFEFKTEPCFSSPQEYLVSQGPSSGSGMTNYSHSSDSGCYQDYNQPQVEVDYNYFQSFLNGSYEDQIYNKQMASSSYGQSPVPTPSPGNSLPDMKEERLTPNNTEILDLDSQKVLNNNSTVNQTHFEPLPSMWRSPEHFQSSNKVLSVDSNALGMISTSNLRLSGEVVSSPANQGLFLAELASSSTGNEPSPPQLGPSSGVEISPTGIHPSSGMGPSPTELRTSTSLVHPSTSVGYPSSGGPPMYGLTHSPTELRISPNVSVGSFPSGFGYSSSLVSSPSSLGSSTVGSMHTGLGLSSGFNSSPSELATIQTMPPPLQQSLYDNRFSNPHIMPVVNNLGGYSSANSIPSYYAQGFSANSAVPNNSSIQFKSTPTQSPSPRAVPATEYPSNVKRSKSFKCEDCNKWFTSHGHLKRHYNTTLHKNMTKITENAGNTNVQSPTPGTTQPPILSPSSKSNGETSVSSHEDESTLSTIDPVVSTPTSFHHVASAFQPPSVSSNYTTHSAPYFIPSNHFQNFGASNDMLSFSQEVQPTYHGNFTTNPTYVSQPSVNGNSIFLGNNLNYQSHQGGLNGPGLRLMNEYPGPSSVDDHNRSRLENDSNSHQFAFPREATPAIISPEPSGDTGSEASMDSSESNNSTPTEIYKCNECNKTFNRMCYLTQHRSTYHDGEKPFKCNICGKRYTEEVSFTDHQSKHAGDKPYKCQACPKQFNHKTDLRRHMCLHTGEKPYSCDHCGKGFIRKDHMIKHLQTHKKKALAAAANASHNFPTLPPNSVFSTQTVIRPQGQLPHPSPGSRAPHVASPVY